MHSNTTGELGHTSVISRCRTLLLLSPGHSVACMDDMISDCPRPQACNRSTDSIPVRHNQDVLPVCLICNLLHTPQRAQSLWITLCKHSLERDRLLE